MDYLEFEGSNYLAVVDYYSRYPEIIKVSTMTVHELIAKSKAVFARWGIPEFIVSDSGSQFTSLEWQKFSEEFGFEFWSNIQQPDVPPGEWGSREDGKPRSDRCVAELSGNAESFGKESCGIMYGTKASNACAATEPKLHTIGN